MPDLSKNVLVVEDDDLLRSIVLSQLVGSYLASLAGDGEEAWEIIKKNPPDLIVLDLLLPKLDGFGLLERIRTCPNPAIAKIPVIVVSNLSDAESVKRARQYNIEEYFAMVDITLKILLNRVDRVFREKAQQAAVG
jgi:CheY-like chemotaxis protein